MTTDLTPQEVFDYKRKWKLTCCHSVQVDMDSHIWGKEWCRKHLDRIDWSFDKYTRPDDSHTFMFKEEIAANTFLEEYRKYNPRFPTSIEVTP